jgi:hypothetical protein
MQLLWNKEFHKIVNNSKKLDEESRLAFIINEFYKYGKVQESELKRRFKEKK